MKSTKIVGLIMMACYVGVVAQAQVQIIDPLNGTSGIFYTTYLVNDTSSGAGAGVSFTESSSGLQENYVGTGTTPEQALYLAPASSFGTTFAVGNTLLVYSSVAASSSSLDFGLAITANNPVAGSAGHYDARSSFDWLSVSVRPSGVSGTIRVNTSISGSVVTGTQFANPPLSSVGGLWIQWVSATNFSFGYITTAGVLTPVGTATFAPTSTIGSEIGFYGDLRAAGTSIGSFTNLTIQVPQSVVWDVWGGGATPGNYNWSAGNNWVGGMVPINGVDFSGNIGLTPYMEQDYSLTALEFDSLATGAFTIGGSGTLTLSATNAIANYSTNLQVVNVPVSLTGAATVNAASGGLTLSGAVTDGLSLTVLGTNSVIMSGGISGNGSLTQAGNGTLTLSGANNYAGVTTISRGRVVVPGSGSINSVAGMTVGTAAGNSAILAVGGNIAVNTMAIGGGGDTTDIGGGVSAGAGAVYQTNGTVTLLQSGVLDSTFVLGGSGSQGTAGYGYYQLSDGTLNGNLINIGGRVNQGLGVMDVLSGGMLQPNASLAIGRGNGTSQPGYGLLNVVGGAVYFTGVTNPNGGDDVQLMLGYRGGLSALNISSGGSVTLNSVNEVGAGWGVNLMRLAGGSTSVVNLNAGGTLTTPKIFATAPAGGSTVSLLNFNGGTLAATSGNFGANFLSSTNIGAVTIYNGGATVDNNGTAITISNALIAASGNGVQTITVGNGGSNYIGVPLVQITGGTANNGAVATAVANMVDDGSGKTFKIGSITITSPGSYSVDPTGVSIVGNGGATPASASIGTITANISGGLTSTGSGTLTLAGANTYSGNTTVNGGTLEIVQPTLAANSTVTVAMGAVLQLDFTTTNQISGLVLNGVSQPGGVYNSATAPIYITGQGSLLVQSVNTNPTNITSKVIGGNLILGWPADHVGWHLQVQTNSLGKGLGTNWVDVPDTSAANSFTNAISPTNGAVFYRLTYP